MHASGLSVLWFVAIIAMIPASLWLLKRSGLAGAGGLSVRGSALQATAQLSLGPGQRVVTVEVGSGDQRACLVLGVTAQHIQTLHILALAADAGAAQSSPGGATASAGYAGGVPGFASWLQRARPGATQEGRSADTSTGSAS